MIRDVCAVLIVGLLLLVGCTPAIRDVTVTVTADSTTPYFQPTKPKLTPSNTPDPTQQPAATVTPFDTSSLLPTPASIQAVAAVRHNPAAEVAGAIRDGLMPPPDLPDTLNGLPYSEFIIMDRVVIEHMRAIYVTGHLMGRNPHAFTRIGDSTIEPPHFFERFDSQTYNLGEYAYLQRTIDFYAGSFAHRSVAVRRGLHTWAALDPMWATSPCAGGEHMLACEFRTHNPSLILVRLGSNDRGVPDSIERSLREIVRYSIEQGVIPVMATKADRFEGAADTTNSAIRRIAAENALPLWDFDRVAATLPDRGLGSDAVHLTTFYAHDWTQVGGFNTGHGLHNLSGLIMLDHIWQVLHD